MKQANLNDYFDCLNFHSKTLEVKGNKVSHEDLEIDFDDVSPVGKISMIVTSHDKYWAFMGVDAQGNKFMISCGNH